MILPPKRFQDPWNPRYDSIRVFPWYKRLEARRGALNRLCWANKDIVDGYKNQKDSSGYWGVDPRELRDYMKFVRGEGAEITATQQRALDHAYHSYCAIADHGICYSFVQHLRETAKIWGLTPRPFIELWETHPLFWPTGYQHV